MQSIIMTQTDIIKMAKHAITSFDKVEAENASRNALDANMDLVDFIEKGFVAGMKEIGDLFEDDEITLQQILDASKIMNAGMNVLKPYMESPEHNVCRFGNIVMNV